MQKFSKFFGHLQRSCDFLKTGKLIQRYGTGGADFGAVFTD